ncbi:MAG: DNA methyltransferase [Leucobacter sp.]
MILDESQAAELDKQSGESSSKSGGTSGTHFSAGEPGVPTPDRPRGGHNDSGGASRFFYTAKADSAERPVVDGIAHPTVKPLGLMRYLVRLVTPRSGLVLEPFAGSGTTLQAALEEGCRVIGIERESDYIPLIKSRLDRPINQGLDIFGGVA